MPHKDSVISVALLQNYHKGTMYWQGKCFYLVPDKIIEINNSKSKGKKKGGGGGEE